jgi:hypothetical protein
MVLVDCFDFFLLLSTSFGDGVGDFINELVDVDKERVYQVKGSFFTNNLTVHGSTGGVLVVFLLGGKLLSLVLLIF